MFYQNVKKNKIITGIIIVIFMLIVYALSYVVLLSFDNGEFAIIYATIIAMATTFVGYWFSDKIVLATVNARPANTEEEKHVHDMLETLCLAAGLSDIPKFYVIDSSALNAFATGRDKKHAIICVTTGILKKLTYSEIEGVLAHELTHILNNDMAVTAVISVLAGSIVIISDIVRRSLVYKEDNGGNSKYKSKGASFIIFLLSIVLLLIAPLIAKMLQLFASRTREYMADAGAVALTRNPEGISNALIKIHHSPNELHYASMSIEAQCIAELKAKDRERKGKSSFWSTHPTLEERLDAIKNLK